MKLLLITQIFCLLVFVSLSLKSQNLNIDPDFNKKYKEIINEKLRTSGVAEADFNRESPSDKILFERSLGNENQLTNSTIAESEVHAAINPTDSNNWVVCPIKLPSSSGFTLPVYYTKDFGKTWKQSSFLPAPANPGASVLGGGDPVFAYDANGKLYLSWIHLSMEGSNNYSWALLWAYSEDKGEIWKTSFNKSIISSSGTSLYTLPVISDKQWMAVDQSNSAYRNNLYVAFVKAVMTTQVMRIVVAVKPADSAEFNSTQIEVSNGSFAEIQFSQVAVDANGYVHVSFYGSYDKINYGLFHSISKDGGKSFSNPQKISDLLKISGITGIKNSRLYPSPTMVIDNSNSAYKGRIYISWTSTGITFDKGQASDIYFCYSNDTGKTWTTPIIVNDDDKSNQTEQFYSSIHVNNKGVVSISWYDGRYSSDKNTNEIVKYFVAHSFNGGDSFTKNYSVSSAYTDFQTVGYRNNQFGIGEYTQILSSDGYCIPVWSDGRKGNGDLDIFVAVVEIQKNPVGIKEAYTIENTIKLSDPMPNPAKEFTVVHLEIQNENYLHISLISEDGKIQHTVADAVFQKGNYDFRILKNMLPSGVYFLKAETKDDFIVKRLIFSK